MKVKLDHNEIRILINGLNTMREKYCQNTNDYLCDLILRLIDIHDDMKPRQKTRIKLDGTEQSIILHCLVDWRNQFIQEGKPGAAEGVGELILALCK